MPISEISNGEGGGSIRSKLNAVITILNDEESLATALHTALEADAAPETNASNGTPGQWYADTANQLLYRCIATDTWIQLPFIDTFDNS